MRRRKLQVAYNEEHGINPTTIIKAVTDILASLRPDASAPAPGKGRRRERARPESKRQDYAELPHDELERLIRTLEEEMHDASADLEFERAARLRDEIKELKRELKDVAAVR